jgi:hypothetical protein
MYSQQQQDRYRSSVSSAHEPETRGGLDARSYNAHPSQQQHVSYNFVSQPMAHPMPSHHPHHYHYYHHHAPPPPPPPSHHAPPIVMVLQRPSIPRSTPTHHRQHSLPLQMNSLVETHMGLEDPANVVFSHVPKPDHRRCTSASSFQAKMHPHSSIKDGTERIIVETVITPSMPKVQWSPNLVSGGSESTPVSPSQTADGPCDLIGPTVVGCVDVACLTTDTTPLKTMTAVDPQAARRVSTDNVENNLKTTLPESAPRPVPFKSPTTVSFERILKACKSLC